jgi:hypothetical protein
MTMDETVDTLMIDVRAGTQGFAQDVAAMRAAFDGTVVDGFQRAGGVLERGLLGAVRKGSLGFDDLRRVALDVIDEIAAQAARSLFAGGGLFGAIGSSGGGGASPGGLLGGFLGSILGLPGRATGGPVAPGRGYLVGERGPELFVPASAGRVEAAIPARPRDVRVSIAVTSPAASAPQALQRSARQVAGAVRRALAAG